MSIYDFLAQVACYGGAFKEKEDGSFLLLVPQRMLHEFASFVEMHYKELCNVLRSDKTKDLFWQAVVLAT